MTTKRTGNGNGCNGNCNCKDEMRGSFDCVVRKCADHFAQDDARFWV
jgi:hypothetical protein